MFTDTLRRQHEEIVKVLSAVEPLLGKHHVDGPLAAQLRGQLVELAGKVNIHLAAEDRVLYPKLQQGTEPKVADVANRFAKEMGDSRAPSRPSSRSTQRLRASRSTSTPSLKTPRRSPGC